jgi:hypothetical protein
MAKFRVDAYDVPHMFATSASGTHKHGWLAIGVPNSKLDHSVHKAIVRIYKCYAFN